MNKVIIEQNQLRLDQVVNEYYGDLIMFDKVLAANTHITNPILTVGVEVEMPKKIVPEEDDKLW